MGTGGVARLAGQRCHFQRRPRRLGGTCRRPPRLRLGLRADGDWAAAAASSAPSLHTRTSSRVATHQADDPAARLCPSAESQTQPATGSEPHRPFH